MGAIGCAFLTGDRDDPEEACGMRTPKLPLAQSRAAAPLMGMTLVTMAIGLWLPLSPLAGYFKRQALPALAGGDPAGLLHAGHPDEAPVHPSVRLAMS
jgi:hypothetical protein